MHYDKEDNYHFHTKIISDDFEERSKIELYSLNSNELIEDNEYNFHGQERTIKMIIKEDITDFGYMFSGCKKLIEIDGIMNCSNNTNFRVMFSHCSSLQNIDGLKNWNVSTGTDFYGMFDNCSSLKTLDGLKNWNVSNGTNFRGMFENCFLLYKILMD